MKDEEIIKSLFIESVKRRKLKTESITRKMTELKRFFSSFPKDMDIRELEKEHLQKYMIGLKEQGFSVSTVSASSSVLKDLFSCLHEEGMILSNPMGKVAIVIRENAGIKTIFSEEHMQWFLSSIATHSGYGVRDRALFELMYGTGIRVSECTGLNVQDVDLVAHRIYIYCGKGGKDRVLPLGAVARSWIQKWIRDVRSWFCSSGTEEALFVNRYGLRLKYHNVNLLFRQYVKQSGLEGAGLSPHSIRHSFASHLLAHGADIRFVQELLGHSSIETTVGYTQQLPEDIEAIFKEYHPRERMDLSPPAIQG